VTIMAAARERIVRMAVTFAGAPPVVNGWTTHPCEISGVAAPHT
jgi:hypothetical protein